MDKRYRVNGIFSLEVEGEEVRDAKETVERILRTRLPSRTDTRWFHDYVYKKAEIRFIKGRLKFKGAKHSAPFPSMLAVWRCTA